VRIKTEEKEETKLQMAPMIDMVFLLIIFFMTASHLSSSQNVRLDMAIANRGTIPRERPNRWTVNVLADGTILSGQLPVPVETLKQLVTERLQFEPDVKVYLRADKATPHKQVKEVMNAMSSAGVAEFIFGVYSPEGGTQEE
jgi:biopolymer transport protein ExbD